MPRRIDIELTSARPDGSWTWRVAGAKQPKGVLEGTLLPAAAKVGDILRADAEFELEGTVITAVVAPPEKHAPERLTLLGDSKPFEGVTTSLVPKSPRRERSDSGDRPERRGDRPQRKPGRPDGRPPVKPDVSRPTGRRPERPTVERPQREPRPPREDAKPARPRRFTPSSVHRAAVLESLPPEERAVAEQLLNGGVPALRRALQEQNNRAREEGRPEIKADALLALAEELLPRLKAAEWRDRAEAAVKEIDHVNVRDLRSVVAGADAGARDDESRILAKTLREALDAREAAERESWLADVTTCLDEGRVMRALRVAGRPPDPRTRFPAELTTRLTAAASEAMAPETPPDRWAQLLAALLESPVRRAVKPKGLPAEPGEPLLVAARQAAGRVPALAPLLGLTMPPPPGPPKGVRRPVPPAPRGRSNRPPGSRPVPPAPVATQPSASEPVSVEPSASEPVSAEPSASEPVEPVSVEPVSVEPAAAEPVSAEPSGGPDASHEADIHDDVWRPAAVSEPGA